MNSIAAIIVSYYPDKEALGTLINHLYQQVDNIVIVDNGTAWDVKTKINLSPDAALKCHFIHLSVNQGIAAGLNVGIKWAMDNKAKYVVLFDHDSSPAHNMIAELLKAHNALESQGYQIAALGPRYLDERQNNPPPFIRIEGLRLVRCTDNHEGVAKVDYLISSGSLIPTRTFEAVGMMSENLFIDYVDIEWGLRAKQSGFQSFGVFSAHMKHQLGDNPINFFGKIIPMHSSLRHYYLARNATWMYTQPKVPINWKLVDGWRMVQRFIFYSLFSKPRISHFKMMLLGILHGIRGRMGPFNEH